MKFRDLNVVDKIGYSIFGVTSVLFVVGVLVFGVSAGMAIFDAASNPTTTQVEAETAATPSPEPSNPGTVCSGKYAQNCTDEYDRGEGNYERGYDEWLVDQLPDAQ